MKGAYMNFSSIFLDANAEGLHQLTTVGEKFSLGLKVMALGMATVFAVLAILWVILLLFRVVFYREKKPELKKAAPAPAPVKAPAPTPVPEAGAEDNGAIITAITAAIAAYTAGDEEFATGFRVVSFRRAEHASPWNKSK